MSSMIPNLTSWWPGASGGGWKLTITVDTNITCHAGYSGSPGETMMFQVNRQAMTSPIEGRADEEGGPIRTFDSVAVIEKESAVELWVWPSPNERPHKFTLMWEELDTSQEEGKVAVADLAKFWSNARLSQEPLTVPSQEEETPMQTPRGGDERQFQQNEAASEENAEEGKDGNEENEETHQQSNAVLFEHWTKQKNTPPQAAVNDPSSWAGMSGQDLPPNSVASNVFSEGKKSDSMPPGHSKGEELDQSEEGDDTPGKDWNVVVVSESRSSAQSDDNDKHKFVPDQESKPAVLVRPERKPGIVRPRKDGPALAPTAGHLSPGATMAEASTANDETPSVGAENAEEKDCPASQSSLAGVRRCEQQKEWARSSQTAASKDTGAMHVQTACNLKEKGHLSAEMTKLQLQVTDYQAEVNALKEKFAAFSQELGDAHEDSCKKRGEAEYRIEKLEKENRESAEAMSSLQKENKAMSIKLNEQSSSLLALQEEMKTMSQKHKEELDTLKSELSAQKQAVELASTASTDSAKAVQVTVTELERKLRIEMKEMIGAEALKQEQLKGTLMAEQTAHLESAKRELYKEIKASAERLITQQGQYQTSIEGKLAVVDTALREEFGRFDRQQTDALEDLKAELQDVRRTFKEDLKSQNDQQTLSVTALKVKLESLVQDVGAIDAKHEKSREDKAEHVLKTLREELRQSAAWSASERQALEGRMAQEVTDLQSEIKTSDGQRLALKASHLELMAVLTQDQTLPPQAKLDKDTARMMPKIRTLGQRWVSQEALATALEDTKRKAAQDSTALETKLGEQMKLQSKATEAVSVRLAQEKDSLTQQIASLNGELSWKCGDLEAAQKQQWTNTLDRIAQTKADLIAQELKDLDDKINTKNQALKDVFATDMQKLTQSVHRDIQNLTGRADVLSQELSHLATTTAKNLEDAKAQLKQEVQKVDQEHKEDLQHMESSVRSWQEDMGSRFDKHHQEQKKNQAQMTRDISALYADHTEFKKERMVEEAKFQRQVKDHLETEKARAQSVAAQSAEEFETLRSGILAAQHQASATISDELENVRAEQTKSSDAIAAETRRMRGDFDSQSRTLEQKFQSERDFFQQSAVSTQAELKKTVEDTLTKEQSALQTLTAKKTEEVETVKQDIVAAKQRLIQTLTAETQAMTDKMKKDVEGELSKLEAWKGKTRTDLLDVQEDQDEKITKKLQAMKEKQREFKADLTKLDPYLKEIDDLKIGMREFEEELEVFRLDREKGRSGGGSSASTGVDSELMKTAEERMDAFHKELKRVAGLERVVELKSKEVERLLKRVEGTEENITELDTGMAKLQKDSDEMQSDLKAVKAAASTHKASGTTAAAASAAASTAARSSYPSAAPSRRPSSGSTTNTSSKPAPSRATGTASAAATNQANPFSSYAAPTTFKGLFSPAEKGTFQIKEAEERHLDILQRLKETHSTAPVGGDARNQLLQQILLETHPDKGGFHGETELAIRRELWHWWQAWKGDEKAWKKEKEKGAKTTKPNGLWYTEG